jgi:hypothetical protein
MRRRFWREGPLAEIKNGEELEAWLKMQPREVSVDFAARAALRVLPFVQAATHYNPYYIFVPVFRALAFAWAAGRFSDSTKGYAAPPIDLAHFSPSPTAASDAAAAAEAARAAVSNPSLTGGVVRFADDAVRAASSGVFEDDGVFAGAAHANFAATKFWSAVSIDATRVEGVASDISGSPLWPHGQPGELRSLWQEMKGALLAAKQEWQVWTNWYDDRLEGRVRDVERELAYVRIDDALWNQGAAIVNAEIKRRIEQLEPPQHGVVQLQAHSSSAASMSVGVSLSVEKPTPPVPIENVPSAVSFG